MKAYKASKNPFVYIYAVWSIVFVLLPLVILLGNSVLVTTGGESHFSMANFARVLDPLYLKVIWRSLKLALLTTLICLILGYPMAMILAKSGFGKGSIMVILLIIPDVDELFGAYLCVDEFIGRRGNFEYVFKKFGTAGIKRALYRGCGHFGYGV